MDNEQEDNSVTANQTLGDESSLKEVVDEQFSEVRATPSTDNPEPVNIPSDEGKKSAPPKETLSEAKDLNDTLQNRGSPGGVQVKVGDINADIALVIGQVTKSDPYEAHKIKLISILPATIEKTDEVFVAPHAYKTVDDKLSHQLIDLWPRVFLITGPERCGKLTCAIKLGLRLLGIHPKDYGEQIKLYQRVERETLTLIDFVQYKDLPEHSVYIIQDALEGGILPSELESAYLKVLSDELKKKKAFLIITESELERLGNLSVERIHIDIYEEDNLIEVLEKHLLRYVRGNEDANLHPEVANTVRSIVNSKEVSDEPKLVSCFRFPPELDRFCLALCDLPSTATEEDIRNYAEEIQQTTHRSARGWFTKLSSQNEQIYAMLVILFQGVHRNILDELYIDAINHLRETGLANLDDPRNWGLDDILRNINAEESEAGVIRFQTRAFEQEVEKQIKNYHHLLWSLIGFIVGLVKDYVDPEFWMFRRDLGRAIGRLGIHRKPNLDIVLLELARDKNGGVVAVAGSALGEICQQFPNEQQYVLTNLRNWHESGDFDLMRAFCVCVWRVFESLTHAKYRGRDSNYYLQKRDETRGNVVDQLFAFAHRVDDFNDRTRMKALLLALETNENVKISFADLVSPQTAKRVEENLNDWALKNLEAILHAVRQMYLLEPVVVIELVKRWLQKTDNFKCQLTGQLASRHLFTMYLHSSQLIISRHKPLLELIDPILSTTDLSEKELLRTLALAIQNWLSLESRAATLDLDTFKAFKEEIAVQLIHIANQAEEQQSANLQVLIESWSESSVTFLKELAYILNNRVRVMTGYPVEEPGQRYGIVVFDGSYTAKLNQSSTKCVHEILSTLSPQIDLYALSMGERLVVSSPNKVASLSRLNTDKDLPRVVFPVLEAFPLDIEQADFIIILTWDNIIDFSDLKDKWANKIILAFAGPKEKAEELWPDEEKIIVFNPNESTIPITDHIQRRLTQTISTRTCDDTLFKETLLDQFETTNIDIKIEDPARKVMRMIQIAAFNNLSACIAQLTNWFNTESTNIRHHIARAGSRTLFQLFGDSPSPPSIETHAILLTLVPPLANDVSLWLSGKFVLTALSNLAKQSEMWMDRIFSPPKGETPELFLLVDKLALTHSQKLLNLLKNWEDNDPSEALLKFTERVRLRAQLGNKERLPTLSGNRKYIVIVFDASVRHIEFQMRIARIASKLLAQLNENHTERLFTLAYRLGSDQTVAEGVQKVEPESLVTNGMRFTPIIGPILEYLQPESVACVLVLTRGRIIDLLDWQGTNWEEQLFVYDDSLENVTWTTPFLAIKREREVDDAVDRIINRIEKTIGV